MNYIIKDANPGDSIQEVLAILHKWKEHGVKYAAKFNGKIINCDMDIEEAYTVVTGYSKTQFDKMVEEGDPRLYE